MYHCGKLYGGKGVGSPDLKEGKGRDNGSKKGGCVLSLSLSFGVRITWSFVLVGGPLPPPPPCLRASLLSFPPPPISHLALLACFWWLALYHAIPYCVAYPGRREGRMDRAEMLKTDNNANREGERAHTGERRKRS